MSNLSELLGAPLDPKYVKQRNQGGRGVSYIEGWHAISEANRIFGFDGWQRETVYLKEVSREKNTKGNHVVGYEAKVRISVEVSDGIASDKIVREGTGYGSGIASDLFSAIEGAGKEAETDAMKRAFMTFGNPFGLALYDKTQANVAAPAKPKPEPKPEPNLEQRVAAAIATIKDKVSDVDGLLKAEKKLVGLLKDADGTPYKQQIIEALEAKRDQIEEREALNDEVGSIMNSNQEQAYEHA
jgi:DNA repair and recombination protein RAD52